MKRILRLALQCFIVFLALFVKVEAQVQPALENCAGYSVLSLKNVGAVSQSVIVTLNGKQELLTVPSNETKLFKIKEEALRIEGKSVVAKMSNVALCFDTQVNTQFFAVKPITQIGLGAGGGNAILADPICGNGVKESGEQCDDGNTSNCDSCSTGCVITSPPVCGDGVTSCGERCDDGNTTNGDGCNSVCRYESTCGNGVKEGYEGCDDGNMNDCDSCSNDCVSQSIPVCGDGNTNTSCGEQCDFGGGNGPGTGCSSTCQIDPICGNNRVEGTETCDDGNFLDNDGCSSTCQTECGNGVLNSPGEECDNPSNPSCYECKLLACGNGRIDPLLPFTGNYEACDDGNTNDLDSCRNNCTLTKDMTLTKKAFYGYSDFNGFFNPPLTNYITNKGTIIAGSIIFFELKIFAGVGGPDVPPGQSFTFSVKDQLPAGVTYIDHMMFLGSNFPLNGTYNSGTGVWSIPAGEPLSEYYTLLIRVKANNTFTNCAQVTAYSLGDFDSTPNNLSGTNPIEDDESCITINVSPDCPTPTNVSDDFSAGPISGTNYTEIQPLQYYYPDGMTQISSRTYSAYPNPPANQDEGVTLLKDIGNIIQIDGVNFCTRTELNPTDLEPMIGMEYQACANVRRVVDDPNDSGAPSFLMEDNIGNFYYFSLNDLPGSIYDFHRFCVPVAPVYPYKFLVTNLYSSAGIQMEDVCMYKQQPICITPTATASAVQATCANGTPQNNAQIALTGYNNQMRYDYNIGNTYTGGKTYDTATPVPSHGVIASGLPNATTTYTVRIWNADNCFVTRTVTINATTCTTPCSLSATPTNVACNNNSTNNTGTDDFITFSTNPTKTGGVASTTYNLSVSGTTISPTTGTYGSSSNFSLGTGSAGSGNKTVTITDANNPTCSTVLNITDPGTCSVPVCSLNTPTTSVTCDGKGTPDTSDDTYSYNITVTGTNTGATYGISGGDTQSGLAYNTQQGAFGNFLISSGGRTLNITDVSNSSCTTTASLTAPATCSPAQPTCSLNNPTTSSTCNDNGTPSNPNDDVFSYNITVTGTNTGTTYGISGGDTRSGLAYNTQQGAFGTFPISGGNLSLTVSDATNAGCTTSTTVQAPAACSNQVACTMNDPVVVAYCNTNGTPSGADDTFGYTINASGTGVSTLYDVMGDDIRNDLPYNTVNGPYGWYPLSQGALVLNVIDNVDTGCSAAAVVIAPDDCTTCTDPSGICVYVPPTGTCTITAPDATGICNDNGTPSNPADDTFTYVVNVTGTDVGVSNQYNISGGDTRTGLTYGLNQGPFGSFPISGGNLSLTATDVDIPTCMDAFTVTAPASCSNTTPQADLRVVKTASSTTVSSGQSVTYTITVTNDGPSTATNIQIRDVISTMLTYVSNTPSVGSYNVGTGIWTIPTLASGANATLQITVTVN